MPKGRLKRSDESPVAAKVREAIGAGPSEPVEVTTPQFERPPGVPPPKGPPGLPTEWNKLHAMTKTELLALGCGNWDGRLMLFPGEWYKWIPAGFDIIDITNYREKFEPGQTDDDIRAGWLAYGVYATDGVATADK